MTCGDFRRHNSGGVGAILSLTRAERSACARHWTECFECRDWTMQIQFEMTSNQVAAVEQVKAADQRDTETYHPTAGERQRFSEQFDLNDRQAGKPSERSRHE